MVSFGKGLLFAGRVVTLWCARVRVCGVVSGDRVPWRRDSRYTTEIEEHGNGQQQARKSAVPTRVSRTRCHDCLRVVSSQEQ
eukprot:6203439-Prymnesium_polylepis.1